MKEVPAQTFGQWLEKALHAKRLTVGEFYQRAKVSRAGVYHYLRDQRTPTQEVLARIASVLAVPVEEIPFVNRKMPGAVGSSSSTTEPLISG